MSQQSTKGGLLVWCQVCIVRIIALTYMTTYVSVQNKTQLWTEEASEEHVDGIQTWQLDIV